MWRVYVYSVHVLVEMFSPPPHTHTLPLPLSLPLSLFLHLPFPLPPTLPPSHSPLPPTLSPSLPSLHYTPITKSVLLAPNNLYPLFDPRPFLSCGHGMQTNSGIYTCTYMYTHTVQINDDVIYTILHLYVGCKCTWKNVFSPLAIIIEVLKSYQLIQHTYAKCSR